MFNHFLKLSLLGGTMVSLLAMTGFNAEVQAQEQVRSRIRSDITPRRAERSRVDTSNLSADQVSPEVQESLQQTADQFNTTVDQLLQDPQIRQISVSPSGAEVLQSLQQADDGITVTDGEVTSVESVVPRISSEATGEELGFSPEVSVVENAMDLIQGN